MKMGALAGKARQSVMSTMVTLVRRGMSGPDAATAKART